LSVSSPRPTPDQLEALATELDPNGSVELLGRLGGGIDATMELLRLTDDSGRQRKVILRRYGEWIASKGQVHAYKEVAILRLLSTAGLPVSEPVWVDKNQIFQEPALVLEYIDGETLTRPEDEADWARQMARFLARLHAIPVDPDASALLEDNRAEINRKYSSPSAAQSFSNLAGADRVWRVGVAAFADAPIGDTAIVHNDLWIANVLWEGQNLKAVIDWESATLGDPIMDLAYTSMDLRLQGWDLGADELVREYAQVSGRSLELLPLWTTHVLVQSFPVVEGWSHGLVDIGREDLTPEVIRRRHTEFMAPYLEDLD
jgi:aminoglycoside phosphotransferase (APT) family kinase protein